MSRTPRHPGRPGSRPMSPTRRRCLPRSGLFLVRGLPRRGIGGMADAGSRGRVSIASRNNPGRSGDEAPLGSLAKGGRLATLSTRAQEPRSGSITRPLLDSALALFQPSSPPRPSSTAHSASPPPSEIRLPAIGPRGLLAGTRRPLPLGRPTRRVDRRVSRSRRSTTRPRSTRPSRPWPFSQVHAAWKVGRRRTVSSKHRDLVSGLERRTRVWHRVASGARARSVTWAEAPHRFELGRVRRKRGGEHGGDDRRAGHDPGRA
jgi:hypothetical protein